MGAKRKARKAASRAAAEESLTDLLEEAEAAVALALATVGADGADGTGVANTGAPVALLRRRSDPSAPDPVLLDRYQGLLVRSGVVGETVNHLPSRLRERADLVLRDLIVGVSRDRPATTARVDGLVDELLTIVGERIAVRVGEWREADVAPEPGRTKPARDRVSG